MALPIHKWLLENHSWLDLEQLDFTDIGENWLPGLNDVGINFTFNGELHSGRGQSFDRPLAFEKAAAEALERLALTHYTQSKKLKANSSGMAAHRTRALAAKAAMRELIERDILSSALLSGAAFRTLDFTELSRASRRWLKLMKRLDTEGVELKIGELPSDFRERVFICAAFGKEHKPNFCCAIGLGVSLESAIAIEKSIQECLMMMSLFLAGRRTKSLTRGQFLRVKKPGFEHHKQLALNQAYAATFKKRFVDHATGESRIMRASRDLYLKFNFEDVALPSDFRGCPIKIVRAQNPSLQPIILGQPTSRTINKIRLSQYQERLANDCRLLSFDVIHGLG